jgi:hypothetical protein
MYLFSIEIFHEKFHFSASKTSRLPEETIIFELPSNLGFFLALVHVRFFSKVGIESGSG